MIAALLVDQNGRTISFPVPCGTMLFKCVLYTLFLFAALEELYTKMTKLFSPWMLVLDTDDARYALLLLTHSVA